MCQDDECCGSVKENTGDGRDESTYTIHGGVCVDKESPKVQCATAIDRGIWLNHSGLAVGLVASYYMML